MINNVINNISELESAVRITKGNFRNYLIEFTRCKGIWFEWDEEGVITGITPDEDLLHTNLREMGPYRLKFPFSLNDYFNLLKYIEVKGIELTNKTDELYQQHDAYYEQIQKERR